MLRKLGLNKYFVSFRRLFQNPQQPDLQQPRHLNMELLERRLLLSCDTDFTGGVLTISCGAEDDTISVRIDAAGALLLNEVAITGAPSTSNTDEIVIAAGGGDDQITVDQSTGALGPGATDEASGKSEIEVTVDAGAGTDTLTLIGQDSAADTMKPSGASVDINGDTDGDVTLVALEEIGFFGGGGNDGLSLTGWTAVDTAAIGITKISVDGGAGDDVLRNGVLSGVTLSGGAGDDKIYGGTSAEVIDGGDDNDTIVGRGGRDTFYGGAGDDVIKAGSSSLSTSQNRVWVDGQGGNDTILTYNGADTIYGGTGDDVIRARPGKDLLYGGPGNDVLDGGNSDDTLYGEAGNDTLQGKKGDDLAYGGGHDDVLVNAVVDEGDDTLEGGAGNDLFRLKGKSISELFEVQWVAANPDTTAHLLAIHKKADGTILESETVRDVEQVHIAGFGGNDVVDLRGLSASDIIDASIAELHGYGGGGKDTLYGGPGEEYLFGGGARDIIYGGEGTDTLDGGSGPDTLDGEAGDDLLLLYGSDAKLAEGGSGDDQILAGGVHPDTGAAIVSSANHTMKGGEGDDTLIGGTGDDSFLAGAGNDSISGDDGSDTLVGGEGADTLTGEEGSDVLDGGSGSDQVTQSVDADQLLSNVLLTGQGNDTLASIESVVLTGGAADNLIDASAFTSGRVTITGGVGSDTLMGTSGDDCISGGAGDDTIDGGAGDDQLFGREGGDSLEGGSGDDQLNGGSGDDTLDGTEGADSLLAGSGNDSLSGGSGDDELDGGSGNDTLNGDLGDDVLFGRDGDDELVGDIGDDLLQGGSGKDQLDGGSGEDQLLGGSDDDELTISDTNFPFPLSGGSGSDELALSGSGLTLDLTSIPNTDVKSVESIDLTGSGDNTLVLDYSEVLNLSDNTNTLEVTGNAGDSVVLGAGWNWQGTYDGSYHRFTQGAGEVLVTFGVTSNPAPGIFLSELDGTNGFVLSGIDANDWSGISVSTAGDVNGDGYADILIGARLAAPGGDSSAGETYVVFGKSESFGASVDLSALDGSDGFMLEGDTNDLSGYSVSTAGDVNGDGYADMLIAAPYAARGADSSAGETYVVFGKNESFGASVDLSALDGSDGFVLEGIDAYDYSGYSVSTAGDVNGDGYADILIGAPFADPNGLQSGETYVVFGKSGSFAASVDLGTLDGSDGFMLTGIDARDYSGWSVSTAGDVNGDGYADLLIGAYEADPGGESSAGETYVVFGKSGSFDASVDLASLDGSDGFMLTGIDAWDISGNSVSTAGDVNGDGYADILIGAYLADPDGEIKAGETYVVFGKSESFGSSVDLASLDGSDGFVLKGIDEDDFSGYSVSTAGDVNGDGYADLLIGARLADPGGVINAGETYVVFGKGSGFGASVDLSALDGRDGFVLRGIDSVDYSGNSVSSAGDVNGDGYADILIGAYLADPDGESKAGETYLIYGRDFTGSVTQEGGVSAETLTGSSGVDILVGGGGDDRLEGDGGADVLTGGEGDDALSVSDTSFAQVSGGSGVDELELDGSGLTLDLTSIPDTDVTGIERIDITGSGDITLVLDYLEVLNLSDTSNALTVTGDSGDRVQLGDGWKEIINEDDGQKRFIQGAATVLVTDEVKTSAAPTVFLLSELDGSDGFVLKGIDAGDASGLSVSTAGDVNGDGYADILIGAYFADPGGDAKAGETYVVFGKSESFSSSVDLEALDGSDGFVLEGIDAYDYSGYSVSTAGDVNGDGYADILIGAYFADSGGDAKAGETYVVFGKSGSFDASVDLGTLDGSAGFVLSGIDKDDRSGVSVSTAGDINGDGYSDILIGAWFGDPDGYSNAGETYVVFGKGGSFAASVDLGTLDGTTGFVLEGIDKDDFSGMHVSTAGDVNGDGYADILIGAWGADPGGDERAGETYVVFGKGESFGASVDLGALDGTNGFVLEGIDEGDYSGSSVSTAGDVNGDGYSDILIGAYAAEPRGYASGETYVVFGKSESFGASVDLGSLDGSDGFVLEGIDAGDSSGISVSAAGDVNGDGYADILIGAWFGDPDGYSNAGETYVVFGKGGSFAASVDLGTLDGTTGFVLEGIDKDDFSGRRVSTAGDVNGDGYDDILIGAPYADPDGKNTAGETYLIYGRDFTGDSTVSGASADDPLLGTHSTDTRRSELLSDLCITSPEDVPESYHRGDGSDLVGSTQSTAERDDDRERSDIY